MPANRRRTPRAICTLEAKVLGPRGTLRGVVRNLSVGGLFFVGRDLLAVGQSGDFEFSLDGIKVRVSGEVRYHHKLEDGLTAMGVRFIRLEPSALGRIQTFVDKSPQTPELDEP